MTTAIVHDVPAKWRKLLCELPDYDPFALAGDCYFDVDAAQKVIDFFPECLAHIEGSAAGQPFVLERWQQAWVANLFGWKKPSGYRRYLETLLYIGRGNGKTPLASGVSLYGLFCDDEPGAQIYLVASEAEQAAIMYRHARGMVERDDELSARAKIFKGQGHRSIVLNDDSMSSIRVVSSDAGGKHGFAPHMVIGDELHAWKTRELLDALETAFAKKGRRQPLKLWITTADFDRESPCNDKYNYACAVRDNPGDPDKPGYDMAFLPAIWEAKQGDDWTKEETWVKANPNIDITVDRARLAESCRKAIEQPSQQAEFKRLHCNIRTTAQTIFIPVERWDKCGGAVEPAKGALCYGGLDISAKQDITALVWVYPPSKPGGTYLIEPHFWIPMEGLREKEKVDRVPYSMWMQHGFITAVPGTMIDEGLIEESIMEKRKNAQIRELAFDKWNALGLAGRMEARGLTMVDVPQTITGLSAGTKALNDLVTEGLIAHANNPVLRWMLTCTDVVSDKNDNQRPVKPERHKSGKRIDGIIATVMALGRATLRPEVKRSVYEKRGIVFA